MYAKKGMRDWMGTASRHKALGSVSSTRVKEKKKNMQEKFKGSAVTVLFFGYWGIVRESQALFSGHMCLMSDSSSQCSARGDLHFISDRALP